MAEELGREKWIIVDGHKYLLDFDEGVDEADVIAQLEATFSDPEQKVVPVHVLNEQRLPVTLLINLATMGPVVLYAGGAPKPSEIG